MTLIILTKDCQDKTGTEGNQMSVPPSHTLGGFRSKFGRVRTLSLVRLPKGSISLNFDCKIKNKVHKK